MESMVLTGDRRALISLADLACSAAEELDQMKQGNQIPLKSVTELGGYLQSVANEASSNVGNPVASLRLALVRRAIAGGLEQPHDLMDINDVLIRAREMSDKLSKAPNQSEPVEVMRDFCLALSKIFAAESSLRSRIPTHMRYKR